VSESVEDRRRSATGHPQARRRLLVRAVSAALFVPLFLASRDDAPALVEMVVVASACATIVSIVVAPRRVRSR
jgi:hypothetical protein